MPLRPRNKNTTISNVLVLYILPRIDYNISYILLIFYTTIKTQDIVISIFEILYKTFTGGHVVIGVTKQYLTEVSALRDLEPTMLRHEETGIWRMTSRTEVDDYILGKVGVVYVFRLS